SETSPAAFGSMCFRTRRTRTSTISSRSTRTRLRSTHIAPCRTTLSGARLPRRSTGRPRRRAVRPSSRLPAGTGSSASREAGGARRRRRRRSSSSSKADLPRLHQEVRAAVLAPAVFARLAAQEPFLAVADDRDPVRPDALGDEVVHRRARAPIAQREVVLGRAALVGVPLDENLPLGVGLQ